MKQNNQGTYSFVPSKNHQFNNEIHAIYKELEANSVRYNYRTDDLGREQLTKNLRILCGTRSNNNSMEIIGQSRGDSFLSHLNKGKNVGIDNNHRFTKLEINKKGNFATFDGNKIIERQIQAGVFYDKEMITPEQVHEIQMIKAGLMPRNPKLESLACYVVIRGEITSFYERDATLRARPLDRIEYYSCFPNLGRRESCDYKYYAENGLLRDDRKDELKEKFKRIIDLQIQVASLNGEGLDIVTPNAFFYGLNKPEIQKAKEIFYRAIIEVAKEKQYDNFKGLFLHIPPAQQRDLKNALNGSNFPIVMGEHEASSAQEISRTNSLGFNVAECLMGDGLGLVGNLALTDHASQAKEENDTRSAPDIILIFSSIYNKHLLDKVKYQELASSYSKKPRVQSLHWGIPNQNQCLQQNSGYDPNDEKVSDAPITYPKLSREEIAFQEELDAMGIDRALPYGYLPRLNQQNPDYLSMAEKQIDIANKIHAANLVEARSKYDAQLIRISTNYVGKLRGSNILKVDFSKLSSPVEQEDMIMAQTLLNSVIEDQTRQFQLGVVHPTDHFASDNVTVLQAQQKAVQQINIAEKDYNEELTLIKDFYKKSIEASKLSYIYDLEKDVIKLNSSMSDPLIYEDIIMAKILLESAIKTMQDSMKEAPTSIISVQPNPLQR